VLAAEEGERGVNVFVVDQMNQPASAFEEALSIASSSWDCKRQSALTVDTITGGNRERDLQTGFTSPPRFTADSLLSFVTHPGWAVNYFTHKKFELPN
jgi:hypothetical protein